MFYHLQFVFCLYFEAKFKWGLQGQGSQSTAQACCIRNMCYIKQTEGHWAGCLFTIYNVQIWWCLIMWPPLITCDWVAKLHMQMSRTGSCMCYIIRINKHMSLFWSFLLLIGRDLDPVTQLEPQAITDDAAVCKWAAMGVEVSFVASALCSVRYFSSQLIKTRKFASLMAYKSM